MSETAKTYGKQTAVIDGVLVRIAPAHRAIFIERYPDAEYLNNWEFRQRFAQGIRKGRSWDYVKDIAVWSQNRLVLKAERVTT